MADQLGGAATGSGTQMTPEQRSQFYRTDEAPTTYSAVMNTIWGIDTGFGQARGGAERPVPGLKYGTVTSKGGSLGGGFGQLPQGVVRPEKPARYTTLNSALADLHNLPPDKLATMTARLYKAGFYPDRAYAKGVPPPSGKVVTQDEVGAVVGLISTAQRYVDKDGKITKTIDELINDWTLAGEGQKKMDAAQKKAQGQVYQIVTDDPATLRAQVTKVAQAILGRAVSDQEQAALVDQMIRQERAPQEAAVRAGQATETGTDVVLSTARVDAEARMTETLKSKNAVEAEAYGELNYYNLLREALGGTS